MNKEFLKKCWKHPRWHSLMVLIIWIIALALLIGIVSFTQMIGKKKPVKPTIPNKEGLSYEEKWDAFFHTDYGFTYIIKKESETI